MANKGLSRKQKAFVTEYLVDLNATQAAVRAGYSAKTAFTIGSENLRKPLIQSAIQEAMAKREERTEITQDLVLKEWLELYRLDVNDLVEYRRNNCRFCWGIDHEYQWTPNEYKQACLKAETEKQNPPSSAGGIDFNLNRTANPECPECGGEGKGRIIVKDTRNLPPAARKIYNGVQLSKDGLKVLLLDRDKALDNVARHLGMFKDKLEITGKVELLEGMSIAELEERFNRLPKV